MVTRRIVEEQRQIASMLREIEATPTGVTAVQAVRRQRYRVRFGRPLGGGAFTYPWRVITVRRGYPRQVTRSMLIHELGHARFLSNAGRLWSASVEQEYAANQFWAQVSLELDSLSSMEQGRWLSPGHDPGALYDEIRQTSKWHRLSLPRHQPRGLPDKVWALWQAVTTTLWIPSLLRPWRRWHHRQGSPPEPRSREQ